MKDRTQPYMCAFCSGYEIESGQLANTKPRDEMGWCHRVAAGGEASRKVHGYTTPPDWCPLRKPRKP